MISESINLQSGTYQQLKTILLENKNIWGQGFNPADYVRFNVRLRKHAWSKEHFRHFVLPNKVGKVLSSCKLYELHGRIGKRLVRIAEIGEIFTPEERRNKGHATEMMNMLITQLNEEKFDLAVLFSDIAPDFFARHGFHEIRKRDMIFDIIIPAKSRRKVIESRHKAPEVVISLYNKFRFRAFSIERSTAYWDMLRYKRNLFNHLQWDMGYESLNFCEDGSAYAWTLWNGNSLQIKDMVYKNYESVADIFSHLFQKHGPDVLRGIYGWFPSHFDRLPFLKSKRYVKRTNGTLMFADITGQNKDIINMNPGDIQFWSLDRL